MTGDVQLRLVEYSAGYLADHWCDKGHILFVTAGTLTIEHRDGQRYELTAGAAWHVGENGAASHRVVCETGATVFIVD
jgi:quercetin dioxygenase-like cupin family protein